MTTNPRFHNSGIKKYRRCPYAWRKTYIEIPATQPRYPIDLDEAMQRGTLIHDVMFKYGNHCIQNNEASDLSQFERIAAHNRAHCPEAQLSVYDRQIDILRESAWMTVEQGEAFELKLRAMLDMESGIYYDGTIDRLTPGWEGWTLDDYKTSMFVPPQSDTPPRQLLGYGWLAAQHFDEMEFPLRLRLVYPMTGACHEWQVGPEALEQWRTETLVVVNEIMRKVDAGDSFDPEPHPDTCPSCEWSLNCPAVQCSHERLTEDAAGYVAAKTLIGTIEGALREAAKAGAVDNLIGYVHKEKEFFDKAVAWSALKDKLPNDELLTALLSSNAKVKVRSLAKKNKVKIPDHVFEIKTENRFGVLPRSAAE